MTHEAFSSSRRGFTLAELLIATMLTAIISGCIAAMFHAISIGTTSQQDNRRFLARTQSLQSTLTSQLHSAINYLAAGQSSDGNRNYLVYWANDNVANQAVDTTELRMLEYDKTTSQLTLYSGSSAATVSTYSAVSSWYTLCTAAKSSSLLTGKVIASNVTGFTATLSNTTALQARIATINMTVSDGIIARPVCIAVSLRTFVVPQ